MNIFLSPIYFSIAAFSVETIGQYHPVVLHFPIVLFTAALICDLLNFFGNSRAFSAGHWLIITGVILCIPTLITGLAAAQNYDPNDFFVEKHRHLAYATAISSSFYAGLRISVIRWQIVLLPSHFVGLSLLLVALISWTADYGGLITRGETPFNEKQASRQPDQVEATKRCLIPIAKAAPKKIAGAETKNAKAIPAKMS